MLRKTGYPSPPFKYLWNKSVDVAIFDLDNTLINGDSDYLWGQFLVQEGVVDGDYYEKENQRFYDEYRLGTLDIHDFLRFSLKPLADNSLEKMLALRQRFMAEKVMPIMLPAAQHLLQQHREKGHVLLIITATNHFVTKPIADLLNVDDLIATDPELINGNYTGQVSGTPSFKEGKVERLNDWLKHNRYNLASSWFYSDSHNDLPLLEQVSHPIAVDADDTLQQHAEMKGWAHITLRQGNTPNPIITL